mmetsp:Transcript_23702/g.73861  ORF Transcript_23702/g.73861 Transcript_23702/m.73861 type:complete len:316 (-) Transcript_23702:137-1084(-)
MRMLLMLLLLRVMFGLQCALHCALLAKDSGLPPTWLARRLANIILMQFLLEEAHRDVVELTVVGVAPTVQGCGVVGPLCLASRRVVVDELNSPALLLEHLAEEAYRQVPLLGDADERETGLQTCLCFVDLSTRRRPQLRPVARNPSRPPSRQHFGRPPSLHAAELFERQVPSTPSSEALSLLEGVLRKDALLRLPQQSHEAPLPCLEPSLRQVVYSFVRNDATLREVQGPRVAIPRNVQRAPQAVYDPLADISAARRLLNELRGKVWADPRDGEQGIEERGASLRDMHPLDWYHCLQRRTDARRHVQIRVRDVMH